MVFCRNVLIYFSEPAFHQAIVNFAQALRPGGLLFLGHSESLIGRSRSLRDGAPRALHRLPQGARVMREEHD